MITVKALTIATLLCVAAGEDGMFPIGPTGGTTISPNTTSTTKSTTTTVKPTTTTPSTTTTTNKPTTTSKTTTTSTTTTTPTTTTSTTQKPTTSTSPTTPKPTTPVPVNPVGKWALNYTGTTRTCLVLEGAFDIEVFYQSGNATKNMTIKVPSNAGYEGDCQDKEETITLKIDDIPNTLRFNFKKSADSKKYDLSSILVVLNRTIPGNKDSDIWLLTHDHDEFNTPVSNSYKCSKEQTLNLTSNSKQNYTYTGLLHIKDFQVQAFRNATSTKFDQALDCANMETPDVVPIAVGCALAALVIIVLIAYLIGRRRSQARGYLSM